jgi:hypothetical protein
MSKEEGEMNCPRCKAKNPDVIGRYGCTMIMKGKAPMPRIFYTFGCCGEHATVNDYRMSLLNHLEKIGKELEIIKTTTKKP